MSKIGLTENEKQEIIGLIQEGRSLPKEYTHKLYADELWCIWYSR